jgi:hypothetical protein
MISQLKSMKDLRGDMTDAVAEVMAIETDAAAEVMAIETDVVAEDIATAIEDTRI